MKKIIKFLTSKTLIIGILLLAQLIFIFFIVNWLANDNIIGVYVHTIFQILSFFIGLWIISNDDNPVYKIAWLIPVLAFPIFGTFFYIFYKNNNMSEKHKNLHFSIVEKRSLSLEPFRRIATTKEMAYLNQLGWQTFENTTSTFLPSGLDKLEHLLNDLRAAKDFIFLEYFIIAKGDMFNQLFDILKEKSNQGVKIKIIYDDFGCADKLPNNFKRKLRDANIEFVAFNPMRIHLNFAMNYRDHRKIVVIDGKIGYTGGINIGDEYINKKERFGYWQDAAIRIEGEAVYSLTTTFLEIWAFSNGNEKPDFSKYYRDYKVETDGLVLPFADSPLDNDETTRNVYLYLIGRAKKRISVTTPYLILDNELITALKLAAQSGVEVSIIIPHIPDKKLVYIVTQSYVPELIQAGIKVYRYKPGFIHSKLILIDDEVGIVGTSNLDFRSLYLHFENNILLYNTKSLKDMEIYFKETLMDCHLMTKEDLKKRNIFYRILQAMLKGFAPLL